MINIILIIIGLILLIVGANYFIKYILHLGEEIKAPEMLMGILVISFGSTVPEILVAITSGLKGDSSLALGNAYGSSIANLGILIGIIPFIKPIFFKRNFLFVELPFMAVTFLISFISLLYIGMPRYIGVILLIILCLYLYKTIKDSFKESSSKESKNSSEEHEGKTHKIFKSKALNIIYFTVLMLISLVILSFGADLLTKNSVDLATKFHVSKLIIGLSVLSIGTSLPEISSNIIAARKGNIDLITGNLIGSIIFNSLAVVGIASVLSPIAKESFFQASSILILSVQIIFIVGMLLIKKADFKVTKPVALLYLFSYFSYLGYLAIN
ncbi:MAG: hypothetical protein R3Y52_03675 [Psittacicella sp.]